MEAQPNYAILATLLCIAAINSANAHGCMNKPNQRGTLAARSRFIFNEIDSNAPNDSLPHFPAGDKTPGTGFGKISQIKEGVSWTPFAPLQPGFRWRAGVCGDLKGPNEAHRKGGELYYGGKVVKRYKQGDILEVGITIAVHHNGFMEMHLCDVDKCPGGEISEQCFTSGHCYQLERVVNDECDSGESTNCGPVDRNHTGRWYLPCTRHPLDDDRFETFGPTTIQYRLPANVSCDHCVLQWYLTAANDCNPPGLVEYFKGDDRPVQWLRSKCIGQAGSVGGFNELRPDCGGDEFAEEYYQCADIGIDPSTDATKPSDASEPGSNTTTPMPLTTMYPPVVTPEPFPLANASPEEDEPVADGDYDYESGMKQGYGSIRDIVLVGDGLQITSLLRQGMVNVTAYTNVTIEGVTEVDVENVSFDVNLEFVHLAPKAPFYIAGVDSFGDPLHWASLEYNQWMDITVWSEDDSDPVRVQFVRDI